MEHNYRSDYGNVTLRPLKKDDIEFLRKWRNDPQNNKFLSKIPYITQEMQLKWYENYLQNKDEFSFAIEQVEDSKQIVGSLSLHEFCKDSCLLGRVLVGDPEAHGKGVGINASKAALKIAFEQMGMANVKLHVFKDNNIAVNVYKKAGFSVMEEIGTAEGKIEYIMIVRKADFFDK